jgi:AraC-like DNA-binding protein/mannose-6-phosphate isomerase-like protein (cupin superfamily)
MASQQRHRKTQSHLPPVLVDPSEQRRILDFRRLGFDDVLVLGRYRYAEAHPALRLHSHGKMVEICYLESGRQTYSVGGEQFHLNGGDLFVTFPNERHGSDQSPEGKGVLYWMLIQVPGRHERLLSLAPAESRLLLDRLLKLPARQFPGGEGVSRILRRVMGVFDRDSDPLRLVNLQNLLLRFLLDVLEASHDAHRRVSPEIRAVQQAIAENLDQALPIRRLALLAHMSQSRLKARFKAEVGVPPADYVMRQRIDRTKQLLRQGDLSVTEIALRLGFSSTQYFATAFKRYTGQTPSSYRRQCEGEWE